MREQFVAPWPAGVNLLEWGCCVHHPEGYLSIAVEVTPVWVTMLCHDLLGVSASLLLALQEWEALWCAFQRVPKAPAEPPNFREATRRIAQFRGSQASDVASFSDWIFGGSTASATDHGRFQTRPEL